MWYILLTLWSYCAITASLVCCELYKRRSDRKHDTFTDLLQYAALAFFIWPWLVADMYEEWNG